MVRTQQIEQTPAFLAWDRAMEWPLIAVAMVFGGTYAWQVLADPVGGALLATQLISLAAWAVFAIDYGVRLKLTAERRRWFWQNLLSLAVVVLPILRPLRLVRLLTLFTVFQRAAGTALRGRVVIYAASTTTLLVLIAALAVYQAERYAPGANITTFGDALWWACVTVTTVGYGDLSPVTTEGRCVAVVMMICGIALLGTVTATIASWLVESVSAREEAVEAATQAQVDVLSAKVNDLHALLTAAAAPAGGSRFGTASADPS